MTFLGSLRDGLPWVLSGLTIWMTLLAGNGHRKAWIVGLVSQALWLVWIVAMRAWGLLPLNIALWIVYARNHRVWNKAIQTNENPPPDWLNRRAEVEQYLLDCYQGKRDLPDKAKCRELAYRLGVPSEFSRKT